MESKNNSTCVALRFRAGNVSGGSEMPCFAHRPARFLISWWWLSLFLNCNRGLKAFLPPSWAHSSPLGSVTCDRHLPLRSYLPFVWRNGSQHFPKLRFSSEGRNFGSPCQELLFQILPGLGLFPHEPCTISGKALSGIVISAAEKQIRPGSRCLLEKT